MARSVEIRFHQIGQFRSAQSSSGRLRSPPASLEGAVQRRIHVGMDGAHGWTTGRSQGLDGEGGLLMDSMD